MLNMAVLRSCDIILWLYQLHAALATCNV